MAFSPQPLFQDSITQGTLGALNDTVTLVLTNSSGAIVNISGTWVGTILFEGSNDGFITSQNAAVFTPPAGVITTGVTANSYYRFVAVSGFTQIRARMSAYTSGSASVTLSASIGAGLAPTVSINYDSMLGTSKIIDGSGSGSKASVSVNKDLGVSDVLGTSGLDTIINLTTTPVEGIVGGSALANRKYFIMEALSTNVKWGFSNTTQSFDLFKSQLIMVPVGPGVHIWFKVSSATGSVAIGELS